MNNTKNSSVKLIIYGLQNKEVQGKFNTGGEDSQPAKNPKKSRITEYSDNKYFDIFMHRRYTYYNYALLTNIVDVFCREDSKKWF